MDYKNRHFNGWLHRIAYRVSIIITIPSLLVYPVLQCTVILKKDLDLYAAKSLDSQLLMYFNVYMKIINNNFMHELTNIIMHPKCKLHYINRRIFLLFGPLFMLYCCQLCCEVTSSSLLG